MSTLVLAPPEFVGSEKGRSLISAYRSLAIITNTPGFKKLSTALGCDIKGNCKVIIYNVGNCSDVKDSFYSKI